MLNQHPADIAEQLTALNVKERNIAFYSLSNDDKVEVFSYFEPDIQYEIVKSLTDEDLAEVLNNLDPDDRTELFENFPDQLIKHSINLLNPEERATALNLIGYKEDSIARLMTPNYIQVKEHYTVKQVLAHIKKYGKKAETLTYIFIVDGKNRLIDDLKIGEILLADEDTKVEDLIDHNFVTIKTTTPL